MFYTKGLYFILTLPLTYEKDKLLTFLMDIANLAEIVIEKSSSLSALSSLIKIYSHFRFFKINIVYLFYLDNNKLIIYIYIF